MNRGEFIARLLGAMATPVASDRARMVGWMLGGYCEEAQARLGTKFPSIPLSQDMCRRPSGSLELLLGIYRRELRRHLCV